MNFKTAAVTISLFVCAFNISAFAAGPSTDIKSEYLMTLTAQLDAGQVINNNLFIYNVPSGTVDGPKINGVIKTNPATDNKFEEGKEIIKAGEQYFITAPTFQTASAKYAWLNELQAVGKQIELKGGEGSYIRYDIFAIR